MSSTSQTPIDQGAKVLLELSLRHGMSDEELAALARAEPAEIAKRRSDALAALGHAVDEPPAPARPTGRRKTDKPIPVPQPGKPGLFDRVARAGAIGYLIALIAAVIAFKALFIETISADLFFGIYGVVVCSYIVSRFAFSLLYRPSKDHGMEPHVAIIVPGFNEEEVIGQSLRSLLSLDYPAEKLEIVAVNDGSTDDTLFEMEAVAEEADGRVRVIDLGRNRGKRAAMAAGIRATDAEMIAFVDSDSVLEPDAMTKLVQGFHDPEVGAICGHAEVLNLRQSWLTRMQAVRYFVAFKVVKGAESLFNAVTCCSGCFSAYRREAILPRLDWWESQSFLGVESTFGDDRSLTNCVLRDWKVKYESQAVSHTVVPHTFKQFMTQQTRWKRSWTRESLIVARFIWRKHPIAALTTYVGMVLPLIAPIVAIRAGLLQPLDGDALPLIYLAGIYAMAVAYGLYYVICKPRYDSIWIYGVVFCCFYVVFMLWQTYYAIMTVRTAAWGTRPATAGMDAPAPATAEATA